MKSDKLRMGTLLALSALLYGAAIVISLIGGVVPPLWAVQLQTVVWKLGHITMGGHLGYWVSRLALGRVSAECADLRRVARAIIIGSCVLAVAQGM